MTNPDREELVKIADDLSFIPSKEDGLVDLGCVADVERDAIVTALRRLASSDGGVKGEPEPVAWIIPGDGNARDNGAIDAMAWEEGEFTKPLYAAPPADAGMREALDRRIKFDDCVDAEPSLRQMIRAYYGRIDDPALAQKYADRFIEALTAPGATTKSDGGAKAGSSPILASKEDQRPDTHGMMPVGDNAANVGCTGVGPSDPSSTHTIAHDGFTGTVIGHYVTREGKEGVVLQQVGTRVVHVYGRKWIDGDNPSDPSSTRSAASLQGEDAVERVARIIIGPRLPVPDNCQFTLEELRSVRWSQSTKAEQQDALNAARAILTTGLVPDEATIRADEREKCAARFRGKDIWTGEAIAAAIRSGGGE